jgi:hypothetical protein
MILFTMGLTSWSVWPLNNIFSVGFLSSSQTLGVWFLELTAYILLANLEYQHLRRTYAGSFEGFKNQVPFPLSVLKTQSGRMDIPLSFPVLPLLLFGVLALHQISPILYPVLHPGYTRRSSETSSNPMTQHYCRGMNPPR